MDYKILIDNRPFADVPGLVCEHGFALYFEYGGERWLFDTGASGSFIDNARLLGVNIEDIDNVVISHGHNDHTGGLGSFLEINRKAVVYISSLIPGTTYYSMRRGPARYIHPDPSIFERWSERFRFLEKGVIELAPGIDAIFPTCVKYPMPAANAFLYAGEERDSFAHELFLLVKEGGGFHVLSSCSHRGLLNILEDAANIAGSKGGEILSFTGGMHFVDIPGVDNTLHIKEVCSVLRRDYPNIKIATGHCNSDAAMDRVAKELELPLSCISF